MRRIVSTLCAGVLGLMAAASSASAGVVTETYAFTFNNFIDATANNPSPLSNISGSFTLTFDPSLSYSNDTADIVVNFLSDPFVSSPIGFDNVPSPGPGQWGYIAIGGILNDADFIAVGTDDFTLNLKYLNPGFPLLALCSDGYACGNAPGSAVASGYTLAAVPDSAWLPGDGAVPEPATWAMLTVGFGALGAILRRRTALA